MVVGLGGEDVGDGAVELVGEVEASPAGVVVEERGSVDEGLCLAGEPAAGVALSDELGEDHGELPAEVDGVRDDAA